MSRRRIRAIVVKELREFRRNRSVVVALAIFPLIFLLQPLVAVFIAPVSSSAELSGGHVLLYMLAIPVLTPAMLAGYAVAGERQQGSLEPVLTTPIRREEFLLGKALAILVPSVAIAYAVYAFFVACVAFLADPDVAAAVLQWPDILAQVLFTPAPRRVVDLGRNRDLDPIERRPRRSAAQPSRQPPAGRRDLAHRVRRDPRDAWAG
ncbi:MAG TPA: ABC transporter permease subunit, partial [Patescibacteria group bacterium]|nr:ABC transporter permease subunit [Patescibacteria group bacterium]